MRSHLDKPPSEVVLDLVLLYTSTMTSVGRAAVLSGSLVIATRNHLGQFVSLSTPVHFDGEPDDEAPRFVLQRLGPSVWKLRPSIAHDLLHAYVTIVGVPPDVEAGWAWTEPK